MVEKISTCRLRNELTFWLVAGDHRHLSLSLSPDALENDPCLATLDVLVLFAGVRLPGPGRVRPPGPGHVWPPRPCRARVTRACVSYGEVQSYYRDYVS